MAPAAAIVLASLAAPHDPALDALLGEVAARALRGELVRRARRWAAAIAPGHAHEAEGIGAAQAALAGHEGPVLLVAPDVPGLDVVTGRAALDDLAAGVEVAVAPAWDGGPYLVGLPDAGPDRLAQVGRRASELAWSRPGAFVGLLRVERRLASAEDARALAADPCTPLELGGLLAAGLDVRARRR